MNNIPCESSLFLLYSIQSSDIVLIIKDINVELLFIKVIHLTVALIINKKLEIIKTKSCLNNNNRGIMYPDWTDILKKKGKKSIENVPETFSI